MKVEALVLLEPGDHIRMLVGAVVVEDDVDLFAPGNLAVDQAQERQELLVAVAGEAPTDELTG